MARTQRRRFESTDPRCYRRRPRARRRLSKHDRPIDRDCPRTALEPDDIVLERIGRVRHGRRLMHLRSAVFERDRARTRSELEPVPNPS